MHSQVMGLTVDKLEGGAFQIISRIPAKAKCIILGERLERRLFDDVKSVCEKRNIPYIVRDGQRSLDAFLSELVPARSNGSPKPTVKQAEKGSVSTFVAKHANLQKGSAEEGRRVFRLMQESGIQTTVGSVTQCIAKLKRQGGLGEKPRSIQSRQAQALTILDQAIENLSLVREYVADTEQENNSLRERLKELEATFSRVFKKS